MFEKIAPQKVRHKTGYIVQVGSRHSVEYIDDQLFASVEVEFAPKVTLVYEKTLKGSAVSDHQEILNRIAAGLVAMGCNVELG